MRAHWRRGRSGGIYYQTFLGAAMTKAVKKAISLPADLAAEVEAIARDENRSLSAVVQDALRAFKRSRLRGEFRELTELVVPHKKLAVLDGEPDNRILECAATGQCWISSDILLLRQFLDESSIRDP